EINQAMTSIGRIINAAAGNILCANQNSKAERGFARFDDFRMRAKDTLVSRNAESGMILSPAFYLATRHDHDIGLLGCCDSSNILKTHPLACARIESPIYK